MSDVDAPQETSLVTTATLDADVTEASQNEKFREIVHNEAQKYRDYSESEEYRNSAHIKNLRKKDRDRQADGTWNERRRKEYAVMVALGENREVRSYVSGLSVEAMSLRKKEEAKKRQAKHRANLTATQIEDRRKANAERERQRRAARKAAESSGT
ncbi:hypothetical protein FHS72_002833 [Loktanella ponticola]|uniref:Uncharacterized protein n=1 Tax=Yoonia ponticola TaxID=1524255 RepID=A0A7W9BMQ8_9RHOB|nr:hypothetical protein [Yoonia ponticola]MBB5723196.1 hypothetical protein [Yoonia ponticola]